MYPWVRLQSAFMKNSSIVTIGNEILAGLTVDTNAAFLARELQNISIPVVSSYTVADEIEAIVLKLTIASSEADIIITTGGLGPTDDDITRQAFAIFLGVELELRENILKKIQDYFKSRNFQAGIGRCLREIKFRPISQPEQRPLPTSVQPQA